MTEANHKRIFFFGEGQAEGGNEVRHLVGGKGASLADMTRAHLNVPPGFTISAECCDLYYAARQTLARRSGRRGSRRSRRGWRSSPAGRSAAATIRCWSRSAPARPSRCPA